MMYLRATKIWGMLFLFMVLSGCAPKNLFANGSFEQGSEPWFFLESKNWAGFSVSDRYAVAGRHSAHIALRASRQDQGAKVFGLIQEVNPKEFPKKISGYYRIENWKRGTEKQYLQFVIGVWQDEAAKEFSNIQIRYILTGITEPPFRIANGRFLFLGETEPPQGRWVYFERDLHADFSKLWGHVPKKFEKIRVLFEARYDQKEPGADLTADVYYDVLYLGD